ncbi:hypothetical protein, partial [Serratia microhaemolytica]|uniref:hypothetical protein n=1 Tax=Serratia microhaemolytica TaxID=2675110 RepID=UPI00197E8E40
VIKMLLFLLFGVWHGLFSSRGCDGENNERLYSLRQGEATGRLLSNGYLQKITATRNSWVHINPSQSACYL